MTIPIEIGDVVAADGRAGVVVDFVSGRILVRPFPRYDQVDLPRSGEGFVPQGEITLLWKGDLERGIER